jgi:hypothetical protein
VGAALPSFTPPSTKKRSVSDSTTELRLILIGAVCWYADLLLAGRFRSRFLPQGTIGPSS